MSFFISDAVASASMSSEGFSYSLLFMLLGFCLVFYVIILRPQQKRVKEHKKLIDSISQGDEILTNGGLVGRVMKVQESDYIFIALNDITEVLIKRDFVTAILPKGTMKGI